MLLAGPECAAQHVRTDLPWLSSFSIDTVSTRCRSDKPRPRYRGFLSFRGDGKLEADSTNVTGQPTNTLDLIWRERQNGIETPHGKGGRKRKMSTMGICGDNCLYCPRYVATQGGKAEELEKVKELWVRLGFREPGFPAQNLACQGCAPENDCAYPELRSCVYSRGIERCGLCEAYPCGLVNAVLEKSERLCTRAALLCTTEEMEVLRKAFFSKRQNLGREGHRKA